MSTEAARDVWGKVESMRNAMWEPPAHEIVAVLAEMLVIIDGLERRLTELSDDMNRSFRAAFDAIGP